MSPAIYCALALRGDVMLVMLVVIAVILTLGGILFLIVREERALKGDAAPRGTLEALWDGTDRREHPRWLLSCPIRYRIYPNDVRETQSQAQTLDAGAGGIAARIPERLASGVWLELEIALQNEPPIRTIGEVRWSRELLRTSPLAPREFLIGINFRTISVTDIERLRAAAQQKESA